MDKDNEKKYMIVNEVSRLTGVSVRTLHYYDEIGLLTPDAVSGAGYRLYGESALARLQSIMLFRELKFPLKDIKIIMDSTEYDEVEALRQQIELLEMQRNRLGELIVLAQERIEGKNMSKFKAFDSAEIEKYEEEIRQRWGDTQAYQEYKEKKLFYEFIMKVGDNL